jgi:hypothetical protein
VSVEPNFFACRKDLQLRVCLRLRSFVLLELEFFAAREDLLPSIWLPPCSFVGQDGILQRVVNPL